MPVDLDKNSSATKTMSNTASGGEASVSSTGDQPSPPKPPPKKKRNQPGMPDPDAEVIALSPKSLLATNRFVCEICNKGFQRDQNLQLHRRGHNLPWKLRQRSSTEVKKRVYVCPEPTCVHHDPSRALGDLTGIKKHFCRKHGEKKWKCDKCSKKYAVQSDWKAHSKICGTREYKCDCGTLFSRRDSFITHRAFCDALAEESARAHTVLPPRNNNTDGDPKVQTANVPSPPSETPRPPSPVPPSATVHPPILPVQSSVTELLEYPTQVLEEAPPRIMGFSGTCSSRSSNSSSSSGSASSSVFASLFVSTNVSGSLESQNPGLSDLIRAMAHTESSMGLAQSSFTEPISLRLATNHRPSLFSAAEPECRQYAPPLQPAMSATALLQKAAQMGAAATGGSLLRGLGLFPSSSTGQPENLHWIGRKVEPVGASVPSGLGLGLPCDEGSGLKELMMGSSPMFGPKQPTLDFLGLGMAAGGSPNGGLSALITSIGGGLDVAAAAAAEASFGAGDYAGKDMGRSS
ncbi:hypothetical protein Nepgr_026475 [Nepenthes gracilis]|uniref:C2H2-type domain-containing protein n=1 Tax=Nepenthes gracilis TaxID=150966 RepID=A0AAD3T9S5_NEPGR|nr:hypothetical protein Nepgr_026475 [Nepenthes gracilis]